MLERIRKVGTCERLPGPWLVCMYVTVLMEKVTSSLSSQDGWTALMLASGNGHREIAQLLVDRGADVNTHKKVGNCAFPIKNSFYY